MAKRKRKPSKAKSLKEVVLGPTNERENHNDFENSGVGVARRVTPVLDTLLRTKRITESEWAQLTRYRQQADICNRSETRDSLDRSVGGGDGDGHSMAVTSAKQEVAHMNLLLGNLQPTVWAIAVEDKSLSQWACEQGGSTERTSPSGKVIAMVPKKPDLIDYGRWELKFAAKRLEK